MYRKVNISTVNTTKQQKFAVCEAHISWSST